MFERRFNADAAVHNGLGVSLEHDCFNEGAVREAIERLVDARKAFQEAASGLRGELVALGGAAKVLSSMDSNLACP